MKTKIKWFQEVLELEPGSKVFFPLARLYWEDGKNDEAVSTLRRGLERNPDHLEARFLLVEILDRMAEDDTAEEETEALAGIISRYPSFWRFWAKSLSAKSRDGALALSFLSQHFQGRELSWSNIIEKGLESLFGEGEGLFEDKPREAGKRREEDEASIRTRTMAELLANQGDYRGALEIYEELLSRAEGQEKIDLQATVLELREKAGEQEPSSALDFEEEGEGEEAEEIPEAALPGKENLMKTLEALADRLEARAAL